MLATADDENEEYWRSTTTVHTSDQRAETKNYRPAKPRQIVSGPVSPPGNRWAMVAEAG